MENRSVVVAQGISFEVVNRGSWVYVAKAQDPDVIMGHQFPDANVNPRKFVGNAIAFLLDE